MNPMAAEIAAVCHRTRRQALDEQRRREQREHATATHLARLDERIAGIGRRWEEKERQAA